MEKLWKDLLKLKKEVDCASDAPFASLQLIWHESGNEIRFNSIPEISSLPSVFINTSAELSFSSQKVNSYKMISEWYCHFLNPGLLGESNILFLRKYLPYCFSTLIAKKQKKAFIVSHFAQTLDAKIATISGRSKGIGNDENLIHSHRMRALCDGIMIGRKTYENDSPQLTVRLVTGKSPAKFIISKEFKLKNKLKEENITWICSSDFPESPGNIFVNQLNDESLNCDHILKELYNKEVFSVYLEGGSYTTSQFLASGNINVIQLHISPIIFGTGIQNFILSPISQISESISFSNFQYFNIGNEIMFVGEINQFKEE